MNFPQKRIARKLVTPLVGSLFLLCAIIAAIMLFSYEMVLKQQLRGRALELAESYVIAAETKVTSANLIRVTNSTGSFQDVQFVALMKDQEAIVLASNRNRFTNRAIDNISEAEVKDTLFNALVEGKSGQFSKAGDYYQFIYKFSLFFDPNIPPQPLTMVLLLDPTTEQTKLTYFMTILMVGLLIGLTIVGVGLYISVAKVVLKPIKLLVNAVSLSVPLPQSSQESLDPNDEFGRLAFAYDSLMRRLAIENETLSEEKKKSEAAVIAKNEFLAVMTHEIRTPLNGIIGCGELIKATELDEEQQQYVKLITHSGEQLLTIVNDILDLSKIEASKLQLELRPVNIIELLEEIVALFQFRIQDKDIAFSFVNQTQNRLYVGIDSTRLKQVLINLVDNAFKFTERGQVEIALTAKPIDGQGLRLKLAVKDTGIGLTKDQIENIFDKFSQADSSTTRKYGGTGLGLNITSQLIELMGGKLHVVSEPDLGSKFFFEFDVVTYNQNAQVLAEPFEEPQIFERDLTMLIVDDTKVNTVVASKMLKHDRLDIDIALSGIEAINKCRKRFYDVIIMDCLMPSMDGYETTRQIRLLQSSRQSYIFALTASALKETEQRCYDAGMNRFLVKPLTKEGVHEIHDYLVNIKRNEQANVINQ